MNVSWPLTVQCSPNAHKERVGSLPPCLTRPSSFSASASLSQVWKPRCLTQTPPPPPPPQAQNCAASAPPYMAPTAPLSTGSVAGVMERLNVSLYFMFVYLN